MIKVPTNTRLHDPNHKCYAPVVVIVTSLRTMPQSPADRALGMTRSSVCSYCFCSMGAHFPSPSTIPLLSTTYQQQEPRVSHHLWKQVTVEIDFSSVFYLINSYFSHDFLWFYSSYFYILYSNNDRPSVQQHRYYNCYIFKDVPQTNGFSS